MTTEPSGLALAISILRDAYPRQDFPEQSATLYAQLLSDLDDAEVVDAVRRLVFRSSWLPAIAEIRREVAEAALGLPSAAEAWSMVNDSEQSVLAMPGPVAEALTAAGGKYAVRTTENPTLLRSQFQRDYEERRERLVLETMKAAVPPTETLELGAYGHDGPVAKLALVPHTESVPPRPVWARHLLRATGESLAAPSDEEKSDAIRVLAESDGVPTALFIEAQRIMDEACA